MIDSVLLLLCVCALTAKKREKKTASSESESGTEGDSEHSDASEGEEDRENQLQKLEQQLRTVTEHLQALRKQKSVPNSKPKKRKESGDADFKPATKPPKAKTKKPSLSRR